MGEGDETFTKAYQLNNKTILEEKITSATITKFYKKDPTELASKAEVMQKARAQSEKKISFICLSDNTGKKHLKGKQSNRICELVICCPQIHFAVELYLVLKALSFSL